MADTTYQGNDMLPPPAAPQQQQGPEPLDYRANPSLGTNEQVGSPPTYDNPIDGTPASPSVDQTWKSYDEQLDATRFGGINSPETSAAIFAERIPTDMRAGHREL